MSRASHNLKRLSAKSGPLWSWLILISGYMGSTNTHKDADVRRVLAPLVMLAEKYGVAVLAIMHMNKSEAAAIYRASGSIAFVALARVAHVVAPDRGNPERRILASLKNNLRPLAPSLAFRVENDQTGAKLKWEVRTVQVSAADLLAVEAPIHQQGRGPQKRELSVRVLTEMLRDGARVPVEEIKMKAQKMGISHSTFQRAYRALGGLEPERDDFGGKPFWSLPHVGQTSTSTTLYDQNDQPLGTEEVAHTGQDFS